MGNRCQFCQREFSRRYNRDRHENDVCIKRSSENQKELASQYVVDKDSPDGLNGGNSYERYKRERGLNTEEDNETDGEQEEEEEGGGGGGGEEEEEEEEEAHDSDDDDDDVGEADDNDTDYEKYDTDPWQKLREEVKDDLNSAWEEQVEENIMEGLPREVAEVRASNRLLPAYRKRLRGLYLNYLEWYHDLRADPVHKTIIKTLRSFIEDDDMDYTEAAEAAISKRKYLLNRLFEPEDEVPNETSGEDEQFRYISRKRKYHESHFAT